MTTPKTLAPLQQLGDGLLGFARQMDLWSKSPKPLRPDENIKQNLLNNASVTADAGRVVVRSKIDEAVLNDVIGNALNAIPAQQK